MNRDRSQQITYFLLRIVAGWMFFQSGAVIVLGWFGGMPAGSGPAPALLSQVGIGGLLELVGGAAILLGLFTRPAAFVLSGEMAVAYWQFHAPHGVWPLQNQGVASVLFCFIFLYMAAAGGGEWSLDSVLFPPRAAAKGA